MTATAEVPARTGGTAAVQLKGTPDRSLFAATLGFFFGFAVVALFGPITSRFQEVMHLSPLMVAFLVAAPALSGSLLRIPFSAWVDTTGGRRPFLVLLVLSLIGMAGVLLVVYFLYPALARGLYPVLLALGVLCGCGIATFSVIVFVFLSIFALSMIWILKYTREGADLSSKDRP